MSLFASKNTYLLPQGFEANGQFAWQSPSNIALVKYWGKRSYQLPQNPSLSFTLEKALTRTHLQYRVDTELNRLSLDFTFEGKAQPQFLPKLEVFLNYLAQNVYPFIHQMNLQVDSENTFPHSSGIASSASSMSALAACLVSIEKQLFNPAMPNAEFWQKVSYIGRLGSGSAARSVYPVAALWGQTTQVDNSSDEWAIPFANQIAPVFANYRDAILLVSHDEKSVSSRAGHALMEKHDFASPRYQQAHNNLAELINALKHGDLDKFNTIVELEALTLHGLMMSSQPSFTLLKPNTLQIIELIRREAASSKLPMSFTLDAGPNVHVLYPDSYHRKVSDFIDNKLAAFLANGKWIADGVGAGASVIQNKK